MTVNSQDPLTGASAMIQPDSRTVLASRPRGWRSTGALFATTAIQQGTAPRAMHHAAAWNDAETEAP